MPTANPAIDEALRQETLRRYDILNTPPEGFFDQMVQMAASVFQAPISLVTLVDDETQWFKARVGLDICGTDRTVSFCDHAIRQPDVMVVCDAKEDPRFRDNPLVTGAPWIRFYAGAPIVAPNGASLGSLCIIDTKPRDRPSVRELGLLQQMAALVMLQIENRVLESVKRGALELARFTPDAVVVIGPQREVLFWNRSAERILGTQREHIVGRSFEDIFPDLTGDHLHAAIESSRKTPMEGLASLPDGSRRPIEFTAAPWTDSGRTYVGFVIRDITERKKSRADLETALDVAEARKGEIENSQRFLNAVIENLPSIVLAKDETSRYLLVNSAAEVFLGVPRSAILGRTPEELFPAWRAQYILAEDARILNLQDGRILEEEYRHATSNGERVLKTRKLALRGPDGRANQILALGEDVTEERASAARINYMAHHDPLTSLANRPAFNEHLTSTLRTVSEARQLSVLYLDLDDFKSVNDTLGHRVGDAVLAACARKMRALIPKGALLARFGGDEFAILLTGDNPEIATRKLAEALHLALAEPLDIEGHAVVVGTSIGIAIAPQHASTPEELLRCADIALYEAKRSGRGTLCFFDPDLDQITRDRHALSKDLRDALAREQFEVHYQPVYAAAPRKLVGYEALLRWRHPDRGMISPAEFIPIAEETGLIHGIGEWVLQTACREAASWPQTLQVAVNLSPIQFKRDGLVALVGSCLAQSGLTSSRLELEITESVLLDETMANFSTLKQLKGLGVKIALDDFGVGYSSLSYLRSFPFDKLKIDRSFVTEMASSREAAAIVRAITTLGHSLGMVTTAEGVETQDQLEALRHERCDLIQGYLYGRPAPANQLVHKAGMLSRVASS